MPTNTLNSKGLQLQMGDMSRTTSDAKSRESAIGLQHVAPLKNVKQDNGKKVVKIEGCEYCIIEDEILAWLSLYGEVKSKLKEDCFRDENKKNGNNRKGNYSIMMKLEKNIPQLLPMQGRWIKMYHAGIQKLCAHCFGPHKKQHCTVENKVAFINYVGDFMEDNQDVPVVFFGRWTELIYKVNQETAARQFKQSTWNQEQHAKMRNEQEECPELVLEWVNTGKNLPIMNHPRMSNQKRINRITHWNKPQPRNSLTYQPLKKHIKAWWNVLQVLDWPNGKLPRQLKKNQCP